VRAGWRSSQQAAVGSAFDSSVGRTLLRGDCVKGSDCVKGISEVGQRNARRVTKESGGAARVAAKGVCVAPTTQVCG
jgi:hypothetical protein